MLENKMIDKAIAGGDISVGCMVTHAGTKLIYAGKLFKPWTWLKWKKVSVIVPSRVYSIDIVKADR